MQFFQISYSISYMKKLLGKSHPGYRLYRPIRLWYVFLGWSQQQYAEIVMIDTSANVSYHMDNLARTFYILLPRVEPTFFLINRPLVF